MHQRNGQHRYACHCIGARSSAKATIIKYSHRYAAYEVLDAPNFALRPVSRDLRHFQRSYAQCDEKMSMAMLDERTTSPHEVRSNVVVLFFKRGDLSLAAEQQHGSVCH